MSSPRRSSVWPHHWRVALLALPVMASACHGPLNNTDDLYGSGALPALTMAPTAMTEPSEQVSGVAPLDRAHWPRQTITVQSAQVEHEPTYRTAKPVIASSHRATGAWPTDETAVRTHINANAAMLNGVLEPLGAGMDILLLPIELVIQPPWTVVRGSPRDTHTALLPDVATNAPWHWVRSQEKETNANNE